MPDEVPGADTRRPLFSIVSAVYNVRRYLDEFIDSVESQTLPRDQFEVIAVDDGSTDDSLARLRQWEAERPGLVRVLTKENGGQSTARNLGLEVARGEWVTFTDPDDRIDRKYLQYAARFIKKNPEVEMLGARRLLLEDATGELTNTHPLRNHFRDGDRLRDLRRQGDYFYGSAPVAFFRTDRIEALGLRFDPRVRPHFEDGYFCCRYLLGVDAPLVGFMRSMKYHYRKRRDGTSTLEQSLRDPGRYTNVLRYGYLRLLDDATAALGAPPEWLQSQVIYDLTWYFSSQEHVTGLAGAVKGEVAAEFHDLMEKICNHIDPDMLNWTTSRPMRRLWIDIMLHGYRGRRWHSDMVRVVKVDDQRQLLCLTYHYLGEPPEEYFLSGGRVRGPVHAKTRDAWYHGRLLMHERILWFHSDQSLRMQLEGKDVPIHLDRPRSRPRTLWAWRIRKYVEDRDREALERAAELSPADRRLLTLARSRVVRRVFGNAWVLMDRLHDADDSGERLFRHLRAHRRRINAWFVIEKGTPDWKRLRKDGYRRVVPYGSLRWKLLMLNCKHLVSSHADDAVIKPPALENLTRPTWRFTFLQHGVIKDDLSVWLNHKPIEVFVTSTPQEYESVAGDHTTYRFSSKETVLTGLPRFDRLLEVGNRISPEQRDLVLVVPTWRQWLVAPLEAGSQRRTAASDFFESDFIRQWQGLLAAPELKAACARHGVHIGFLPHPNLQPLLPELDLPEHVVPLSYAGNDVQEYFARAAVMVTDYSSVAFNAAYIDRPVVYFQFDAERMFGGDHVGQGGYFDYGRDGFGPVAFDLAGAVAHTVEALDAGRAPQAPYAERIAQTFTLRDGRCCERVTEAILASARPRKTGR